MVGKGAQANDVLLRERADFLVADEEDSDHAAAVLQRHAGQVAHAERARRGPVDPGVLGRVVGDLRRARSERQASQAFRLLQPHHRPLFASDQPAHDHVVAVRKPGAAVRRPRERDGALDDRRQERVAVGKLAEPADRLVEDSGFIQLAFKADLGAVAVPSYGNERQVKDSTRDPAEDPDHDHTAIEDCEQRRGRPVELDDADDGTVRLIAHRYVNLLQAGESTESRVMPFRSRVIDLRDRLAAQCCGDLRVLAETVAGERSVIGPKHPSAGVVHHEAHDLLGPGELTQPLGTGRRRAGWHCKKFGRNARSEQSGSQIADDRPIVHDELTAQDCAGGGTDEDRDRENAKKTQQSKSLGYRQPAVHERLTQHPWLPSR